MSFRRCRLARFLDPPVSIRASCTRIVPRSASIDNDAMATFELCFRPVVIKKKGLLKQTSDLLITRLLVIVSHRHESLDLSVSFELRDL